MATIAVSVVVPEGSQGKGLPSTVGAGAIAHGNSYSPTPVRSASCSHRSFECGRIPKQGITFFCAVGAVGDDGAW